MVLWVNSIKLSHATIFRTWKYGAPFHICCDQFYWLMEHASPTPSTLIQLYQERLKKWNTFPVFLAVRVSYMTVLANETAQIFWGPQGKFLFSFPKKRAIWCQLPPAYCQRYDSWTCHLATRDERSTELQIKRPKCDWITGRILAATYL